MNNLTAAEERMLGERIQKKQVKEFMNLFGGLVDHCFNSCVDDFSSKAVSGRENGCIARCVKKTLATQSRLAERFAENNELATAQMANQ